MSKVFIIAEAGVNHNGNLNTALKLVDSAVECGADAVKFQTFKACESTGVFAEKAQYQKDNMPVDETQYEMIKKLELPFDYFKTIQSYCNKKGIIFISTPDGSESLSYLVKINVPLIKIGSTEITNPEFLKEIGNTCKPIILSTGMATLGEVEKALDSIYSTGNFDIKLMHCTTDYPTRIKDVNLKAMITLRDAFKLPVGLSDHTLGNEASVAAVALGAEVIEKHITLNREMEGPDHKASMPPCEFFKFVKAIRDTEVLMGDGIKRPTEREKLIMREVRRSIVAVSNLAKGTVLTKNMFTYKRPGYGINPESVYLFEGKKLSRDLQIDEPIMWSDIGE